MSRTTVIILTALVLALGGVIGWGIVTSGELDDTRKELEETKSTLLDTQGKLLEMTIELNDTREELNDTEEELKDTEDELADTNAELASTIEELKDTESELSSTRSTLSSTRTELTSTRNNLTSATEELESTNQQLSAALETLEGLGIYLASSAQNYDAEMLDNPAATNPTWAELKEFLAEDRTNYNNYVLNVYDCSEFSRDVHNNAEASGIRSAVVHVSWTNLDIGHALNAFVTTDYGLVYVDCTGGADVITNVKSTRPYRGVEMNNVAIEYIRQDWYWNTLTFYYYIASPSGGQAVTDEMIIYW